jgi:hypothetical protein
MALEVLRLRCDLRRRRRLAGVVLAEELRSRRFPWVLRIAAGLPVLLPGMGILVLSGRRLSVLRLTGHRRR